MEASNFLFNASVITLFCTGFVDVVLNALSTVIVPGLPPEGILIVKSELPSYVAETAPVNRVKKSLLYNRVLVNNQY